ncbi:hypothetical protein Q9Q95_13440 [Sphingomonas sp. DG1-23]|uniref:hypothetical protein n=1 Tax=Sphingomonas sp. DG1-23 TaxID=3068316 RepID=UPI00273F18FD|nr:hypothetical protein [Sphingomonas sp. DG1-23]MDP5279933.1 hypothetical protein [Sphingomonas sp. DG1-23]
MAVAGGSQDVLKVTIGFTDSPDVGEVGSMLQLVAEAYAESLSAKGITDVRLGIENLQIGSLIAYLTEIIQSPEALLPADGGLRLRAFVTEMVATINILKDASNLHIPSAQSVAPAMGRLLTAYSVAIAAGRALMMRTEVPGFNEDVAELDPFSTGQILPALMRMNQKMLEENTPDDIPDTKEIDAAADDWLNPKRRIVSYMRLESLIRNRAKNLAIRSGETSDVGFFLIQPVRGTPDSIHWKAVSDTGYLNRFVRQAAAEYAQTHDIAPPS